VAWDCQVPLRHPLDGQAREATVVAMVSTL
jgi:hypothetical protein